MSEVEIDPGRLAALGVPALEVRSRGGSKPDVVLVVPTMIGEQEVHPDTWTEEGIARAYFETKQAAFEHTLRAEEERVIKRLQSRGWTVTPLPSSEGGVG